MGAEGGHGASLIIDSSDGNIYYYIIMECPSIILRFNFFSFSSSVPVQFQVSNNCRTAVTVSCFVSIITTIVKLSGLSPKMKILARVLCDGEETVYTIPCGAGNNSIKWLALSSSQRYAEDVPVQLRPSALTLNGRTLDPRASIKDTLTDGDEVVVTLQFQVNVDPFGNPVDSSWARAAFSRREGYLLDEKVEESQSQQELEESRRSKVEFIRTTMSQQMLNWKEITHEVEVLWPSVTQAFPSLTSSHSKKLNEICVREFLLLEEIFRRTAADGTLHLSEFESLLSDAAIFSKEQILSVGKRLFMRVAQILQAESESLSLSGYISLLLLTSQVRFNVISHTKYAVFFNLTRIRWRVTTLCSALMRDFRSL